MATKKSPAKGKDRGGMPARTKAKVAQRRNESSAGGRSNAARTAARGGGGNSAGNGRSKSGKLRRGDSVGSGRKKAKPAGGDVGNG